MKKIILLGLMMIPFTCMATPYKDPDKSKDFFLDMKNCTLASVNYTFLATIAKSLKDEDKDKFMTFITTIVGDAPDQVAAAEVIKLADLAWGARKLMSPQEGAMIMYKGCVNNMGQTT